jgi:hypothetical protein
MAAQVCAVGAPRGRGWGRDGLLLLAMVAPSPCRPWGLHFRWLHTLVAVPGAELYLPPLCYDHHLVLQMEKLMHFGHPCLYSGC